MSVSSEKSLSRMADRFSPFLSILTVLIVWEILSRALNVSVHTLPSPLDFLTSLISNHSYLAKHTLITLKAILIGFGVGAAIAIPLGLLIGLSRALENSLYYVIVVLNTAPKVALAPLLVVWFGYGLTSKVILVAIGAFVPVLMSSIAGFKYFDPRMLYLTKSAGGNIWQTFAYIRFPAALPSILTGLKSSIFIAVVVAIVVEYVASTDGLGFAAVRAVTNDDLPLVFAIITVGGAIGFAADKVMSFAEWLLLPWKRV